MKRLTVLIRSNWLSLLLLGLMLAYIGWQRGPQYIRDRELIGTVAANFTLQSIDSKSQIKLSELHGKKVLLHFFATWCNACMLQLSSLRKIHEQIPSQDFSMLAVSAESAAKLRGFQKERQISYPIFSDDDGQVHNQFQVRSYPTMVWLEADGRIRDIEHGLDLLLLYSIRRWISGSFF